MSWPTLNNFSFSCDLHESHYEHIIGDSDGIDYLSVGNTDYFHINCQWKNCKFSVPLKPGEQLDVSAQRVLFQHIRTHHTMHKSYICSKGWLFGDFRVIFKFFEDFYGQNYAYPAVVKNFNPALSKDAQQVLPACSTTTITQNKKCEISKLEKYKKLKWTCATLMTVPTKHHTKVIWSNTSHGNICQRKL